MVKSRDLLVNLEFYDLMNIYINFVIFRTRGKHHKMFSAENIFRENDFFENIFGLKPFFVEVNGALIKKMFILIFVF